MPKGYVIIVRNYIAEIVEFRTISIDEMPDGTKMYLIETKYGEDTYKESDLSPIRKALVEECDNLNRALRGYSEGSGNQSY